MSTPECRVVLVRHGETAWNREDRVQGWAATGLTDRGREQARDLGAHLASTYDFGRVVGSDLRRTRETALRLHEEGVEPAPEYSRCWRERDFGVYQGFLSEELFGAHPEFGAGSGNLGVRATPRGGESLLDLRERVLAGWDRLLADAAESATVLVVTHGGPIYTLLGHFEGVPLSTAFRKYTHDNCGLTEVHVTGEAPSGVRIVRENERAAD